MTRTIPFLLAICLIATVSILANPYPVWNHLALFENLSNDEMDNLVAPIALYPDPLLAQVLPASTFVEQISEAATWLRSNPNKTSEIDNQSWDVSVKSVGHYPQVLYMMDEKIDWTTALGQCYVNQSTDVVLAIQRLRARARAAGNLNTTREQEVTVETDAIAIVPAQPEVIFVPVYDPQVVYIQRPAATPLILFGAGLAIGAWLNNDFNWHTHTLYYHGWRGPIWVTRSYRHIHLSNVYVNRSFTTININRTVVNRPVNYNNIHHYTSVSRTVNYNNVNVNRANTTNVDRTSDDNKAKGNAANNAAGANSSSGASGVKRGSAHPHANSNSEGAAHPGGGNAGKVSGHKGDAQPRGNAGPGGAKGGGKAGGAGKKRGK